MFYCSSKLLRLIWEKSDADVKWVLVSKKKESRKKKKPKDTTKGHRNNKRRVRIWGRGFCGWFVRVFLSFMHQEAEEPEMVETKPEPQHVDTFCFVCFLDKFVNIFNCHNKINILIKFISTDTKCSVTVCSVLSLWEHFDDSRRTEIMFSVRPHRPVNVSS